MTEPEVNSPAKPGTTGTSEITDEVLNEVIDLGRLNPLTPGMSMQKHHLKKILDNFRILSQVDIQNLDPTIQVNPTVLPLREDEVIDWLTQSEALRNARNNTGEFFRAPKILGEEE